MSLTVAAADVPTSPDGDVGATSAPLASRTCSVRDRIGSQAVPGNGLTTMHGHGTTAETIGVVGLVSTPTIPEGSPARGSGGRLQLPPIAAARTAATNAKRLRRAAMC